MSDNNSYDTQTDGRKSPLKVILLIAVVLVVAGLAYLIVNRMSVSLSGENAAAPGVAQDLSDDTSNPFTHSEAMNLPPQSEMVDDNPNGPAMIPNEALVDGSTSAASEGQTAMPATPSFDVAQAMGPRSLGDVNAPVKLKEYFSLTCNHCANFHNITLPHLKGYIDRGELYIEFHDFPLNAPALRASMVARCLPADKYYGFITLLFKTQDTWISNPDYMTPLRENAKLAGMSDADFDACLANNALRQALGESIQQATNQWKIESTPTFVVNDGAQMIKGAQPAYEFERVFREVTGGKVAPLIKDQQQNGAADNAAPAETPAE